MLAIMKKKTDFGIRKARFALQNLQYTIRKSLVHDIHVV